MNLQCKKNRQVVVLLFPLLFISCSDEAENGGGAGIPLAGNASFGTGGIAGGSGAGGVGPSSGTGGVTIVDSGTISDGNTAIPDVGTTIPDVGTTVDTGTVAEVDSSVAADGSVDGEVADGEIGDATVVPQACSGKPGLLRGTSNETVMAANVSRSFIYHAPTDLDPNTPVPLVIVPHGSTMSGQMMYDLTEYAALADREKFVVVFPDGIDGPGSLAPWNVGSGVCGLGAMVAGNGNDQAFVDELIAFADADQCIDRDHIYMSGFSMGGYFSHESACLRSDLRAIAPHSGGTHDLSSCPRQEPIAVMIMHFVGDSLISYDCALDARDQWVQRNGCTADAPEVRPVTGGTCEYYANCPPNGQVALCSFEGSDGELPPGHAWSGGSKTGSGAIAAISTTESATELGWAFFKEFAW